MPKALAAALLAAAALAALVPRADATFGGGDGILAKHFGGMFGGHQQQQQQQQPQQQATPAQATSTATTSAPAGTGAGGGSGTGCPSVIEARACALASRDLARKTRRQAPTMRLGPRGQCATAPLPPAASGRVRPAALKSRRVFAGCARDA